MPGPRHNENDLTEKEQSFCDLYLKSGEAIGAYNNSLYSPAKDNKNTSTYAATLLNRNRIQVYLHKMHAEQDQRLEISADRVKLEMARIAMFDIRKLYDNEGNLKPVHQLDDDTAAVVAGIEYQEIVDKTNGDQEGQNKALKGYLKKIKLWSKDKQLENLARHFNMFEADRSAGAIKISFNDLAEEKRLELRRMLDSYYLAKSQEKPKLLDAPVEVINKDAQDAPQPTQPDEGDM